MTSCALCRREQEINPELLRARFDEQRMLNLAQRLAIPPPLRSRPSASTAHMTAAEGERRGKGAHKSRVSPTLAREMFGPCGDVGAMSADDLRRRWKYTSAQTSTVGAASASEIRSSWHELMPSDGEQARVESLSCSGDVVHAVGESATRSSTASPGSCSPVAGGSSPDDLSMRWRNLTNIPPSSSTTTEWTSTDEIWGDSGSLYAACLRKRWLEANGPGNAVGHLEVGELSERLNHAMGSQGSGSLSAACLRKRWLETNGLDSSVGHLDVGGLSGRLDHAIASQGSGGLNRVCLRKSWLDANGLDCSVGHLDAGELSERLSNAINSQDSGGSSAGSLRNRWLGANEVDISIGHLDAGELSKRLNQDVGTQGVGSITSANLEQRWNADVRHNRVDVGNSLFKHAVGVVNTTDLRTSLCTARGSAPVG